MKLRLQPIRVYCFHHVSERFDGSTMYRIDWMNIDAFKQAIKALQTPILLITFNRPNHVRRVPTEIPTTNK